MPRDACCWRRRTRTDPESPIYSKETICAENKKLENDGKDDKCTAEVERKKDKDVVEEQEDDAG